jgi:ABC-type sugar transport system ATPase subunit
MVVLNRGRKVCDIETKKTTYEEIVGWITGAREPQKDMD